MSWFLEICDASGPWHWQAVVLVVAVGRVRVHHQGVTGLADGPGCEFPSLVYIEVDQGKYIGFSPTGLLLGSFVTGTRSRPFVAHHRHCIQVHGGPTAETNAGVVAQRKARRNNLLHGRIVRGTLNGALATGVAQTLLLATSHHIGRRRHRDIQIGPTAHARARVVALGFTRRTARSIQGKARSTQHHAALVLALLLLGSGVGTVRCVAPTEELHLLGLFGVGVGVCVGVE